MASGLVLTAPLAVISLAAAAATALAAASEDSGCQFVAPPMGWNSYDSTPGSGSGGIDEASAITAAHFLAQHLRGVGYEYFVLDAGWFGPYGGSYMSLDAYGRLIPNTTLHPSSAGGVGFKFLSDIVHELGLKFGFWIMGGIPRVAVERKLPILGTNYTVDEAADLTDKRQCSWQPHFVYGSRLTSDGSLHPAAVAYYQSLAKLYRSWGVDFIKMDCVFGSDYPRGRQDFEQFSASMDAAGPPYLLSLSPGSGVGMAPRGKAFAETRRPGQPTMARMTADFWDSWQSLRGHFATAAATSNFTGGGFFPDLDMLPLGWLAPYEEPQRYSKLTLAEARSLMNLFVMARAPLIWGGAASEYRANATTLRLLSTEDVLDVARNSCGNRQVRRTEDGAVVWAAQGRKAAQKYMALMNLGEAATYIEVDIADPTLPGPPLPSPEKAGAYVARDLWSGLEGMVEGGKINATLPPHASTLLLIRPAGDVILV